MHMYDCSIIMIIKVIIVDFYLFCFVFLTVLPLIFKTIEHSVRKYEYNALGRFN